MMYLEGLGQIVKEKIVITTITTLFYIDLIISEATMGERKGKGEGFPRLWSKATIKDKVNLWTICGPICDFFLILLVTVFRLLCSFPQQMLGCLDLYQHYDFLW